GQRLSIRGHHGAAGDDVAVPVPVGPLLLQLGVGQVRRGDELRRHEAGRAALRFGSMAWDAEGLKALPADRDGRPGSLDRVRLLGRDVALLLGEDEVAAARHDARRHREHALAGHDPRRLGHVVAPADDDDGAHHPARGHDHEEREEEDVLQARTSSAPAVRKISRTEGLRPGAQWTAMPKRSFVNRGSKLALGRNLGSRPSITMPITVAIPPKRTISSNAIMTNGGRDDPTMPPGPNWKYLPPVTSPQTREVQIVRRKAETMPVSPPISVKRRTRLTGRSRSRTSSISCTGTGVYTVRSRYPFARSSSSARTVVSTWAKTPTIVSVASGMRRVPHRRRKGLLDFDDRERRHHPDE